MLLHFNMTEESARLDTIQTVLYQHEFNLYNLGDEEETEEPVVTPKRPSSSWNDTAETAGPPASIAARAISISDGMGLPP